MSVFAEEAFFSITGDDTNDLIKYISQKLRHCGNLLISEDDESYENSCNNLLA